MEPLHSMNPCLSGSLAVTESSLLTRWIGRGLGYEDVSRIERVRPEFAADWASGSPLLVALACGLVTVLAVVFYLRGQSRARRGVRASLAVLRAVALSILVLILADPVLELTFVSQPKPILWVLFDGSDSMEIADEYPEETRAELAEQFELDTPLDESVSRADLLRAWITHEDGETLRELSDGYDLRYFLLDSANGVTAIDGQTDDESQEFSPDELANRLTTDGEVTALGNAFTDLARRHARGRLAGAIVFSDFGHNSGTAPDAAVARLGVPVSTVGFGSKTARDLAVSFREMPVKMKKGERSAITATVTQNGFDGETVTLRLTATEADAPSGQTPKTTRLGERTVTLDSPLITEDFPLTPDEAGRFVYRVEVGRPAGDENTGDALEPLTGEIVDGNNRVEREVGVIDDYMRLLFVENEPSWEWRFVKEVFHRDELVGMRGFRTYLRAADQSVRKGNELFLPNLVTSRAEFFKNDVIFIGDVRASHLSTEFCEMTKEFVGQFGGGLVVIAGPQHGPGALAETPLAELLPVVVDPDAMLRDSRPYAMQKTLFADNYEFMQLGDSPEEDRKAWRNLARMPWYQPVKRLESTSSVALAVHPTDRGVDGDPQPLIAVRRYGKGEVIYIASNEMWRLRRLYGEKYYRQFWGQMIYRLGLSHALGAEKRFVVRTDQQRYRSEDTVTVTVEAYSRNFEPIDADMLTDGVLTATLDHPDPSEGGELGENEPIRVTAVRPGVFQAKFPVYEPGEYRLSVRDPLGEGDPAPIFFRVREDTVERRQATRNTAVEESIATASGGNRYELTTVSNFVTDFPAQRGTDRVTETITLWDTWLVFFLFAGVLLAEWFVRKWVHLP